MHVLEEIGAVVVRPLLLALSDPYCFGLSCLFDVSIRCTHTPPRAICCSLFFQFFLGPVVVLVAVRLFCVEFVAVLVSAAVGVAIHGVEGSLSPEAQRRCVSLLYVFQRSTTPWEYKSAWR